MDLSNKAYFALVSEVVYGAFGAKPRILCTLETLPIGVDRCGLCGVRPKWWHDHSVITPMSGGVPDKPPASVISSISPTKLSGKKK